jgi:hypothetical protein
MNDPVPSGFPAARLGHVPTEEVCLTTSRSLLMKPSYRAGEIARRGWALTHVDVVFCAMPIVLFLSIVSLV